MKYLPNHLTYKLEHKWASCSKHNNIHDPQHHLHSHCGPNDARQDPRFYEKKKQAESTPALLDDNLWLEQLKETQLRI